MARQSWSALNQISSATDPKGVATQFVRNAFGEVVQETSPDIGSISYVRDLAGNVTAMTDARGQTTTYTRDALGRATAITFADGKTQQFVYDSVGNVSQLTDPSGSTTYSRDVLSRPLQKTQSVADNLSNPSSYPVNYQYFPGGQLAQLTYPSGLNVFYRKNASGQINQVDVQAPGAASAVPFATGLTYTALGQAKAWAWALPASGAVAASRVFDADARMASNSFASYGYDSASRLTGISQTLWASQAGANAYAVPITWGAYYDSRNRLTNLYNPASSAYYGYDANSNRADSSASGNSNLDLNAQLSQPNSSYSGKTYPNYAPTSNRLLGFSQYQSTIANGSYSTITTQVAYTLDAAGNLTSDGLRVFDYDAANRLSKVTLSQNPEAAKVTYLHNALGQRVFKSEPQVAQLAPSASTLGSGFVAWLQNNFGWLFAQAQANATLGQSYIYDDGQHGSSPVLLGEYGNGGTNSLGRLEYIWLPGADTSTAMPIGLFANGRFYSIHSDHLNTPRLIKDDAGQVVWQWPYSGFGENKPTGVLLATPNANAPGGMQLKATAPAITFNLRMAGQYFDEESNLSYNYFRTYQASQGRYTQADPIGLAGGMNRFGYVGANPLSFIDPRGLDVTVSLNGSAAAGAGHVGLGVNSPNTVGQRPQPGQSAVAMAVGQNVPGQISPDPAPDARVVIPTTPRQDHQVQQCINRRTQEQQNYNLYQNNCAQFVEQCLGAAGVPVPDTRFPRTLFNDLQRQYGGGR